MAKQHQFDDLAKGLAQSISRHGTLRRAGAMLAVARLAAPMTEAEDLLDCLDEYVKALAKCENQYTQAVGDADDAFVACLRSNQDVLVCFDQYDTALDNATVRFDECQVAIAEKFIFCWGKV
jgi:hypothetical protein